MKTEKRNRICSLWVSLAVIVGISGPALANDSNGLPYNEVKTTAGGVSYVAGGIGLEAQDRLNARVNDFNMKLVFTLNEGNYIADVDVTVKDAAGRTVLEETADGPYLMAKLPAGRYTVDATFRGRMVSHTVHVGDKDLRTAYMRWPSNPETDFIIVERQRHNAAVSDQRG